MLEELQQKQQAPTTIFEDNQSTIFLVRNPTATFRTRHIALRLHFVREKVSRKVVDVVYCPTKLMIADLLTKILPKPQHCALRSILLGKTE
jgi:hypothetical protein